MITHKKPNDDTLTFFQNPMAVVITSKDGSKVPHCTKGLTKNHDLNPHGPFDHHLPHY